MEIQQQLWNEWKKILPDTNIVLYLLFADEIPAVFVAGQENCISIIPEIELLSFLKITEA